MGNLFASTGLCDEKPHERDVEYCGFAGRRPYKRQNENPETPAVHIGAQPAGPEAGTKDLEEAKRLEEKPCDETLETKRYREDTEGRSASTVHHRSLWESEENETSGRMKPSPGNENQLWNGSSDLFSPTSPPLDSVYETAKTERKTASCCPDDQKTRPATKERKTLVFASAAEESDEDYETEPDENLLNETTATKGKRRESRRSARSKS